MTFTTKLFNKKFKGGDTTFTRMGKIKETMGPIPLRVELTTDENEEKMGSQEFKLGGLTKFFFAWNL